MNKLIAIFALVFAACMVPPADATGTATGEYEAIPIAVNAHGTDVMCAYDGTTLTLHLVQGETTLDVSGTPSMVSTHVYEPGVAQWFTIGPSPVNVFTVTRTGDDITAHIEAGNYPDQSTRPLHPYHVDVAVHGCL